MKPILAARSLSKSYGAPVLWEVDLEVGAGEVHAVIGENGAGKSTLAKIIAGVVAPEAGAMELDGAPFAPRDRAAARDAGVGFVMQELNLIGSLSVAENLFLDRLPHRLGRIDRRILQAEARQALARVGLDELDPERPASSLGVGQQQLVEIAATLARRCSLILLDEPTAALSHAEIERLFAQVEALRSAGRGIVFISHRLGEVERLADRISVLRDGRLVARHDTAVPRDQLVREMVGRDVAALPERRLAAPGPVALEVEGLSGPGFEEVSLTVRRGEILGLAGLMGAGRTAVLRAIFGADRPVAGRIRIGGAVAKIRSPRHGVDHDLALLPDDRKSQGLLLPFSVRANVTLGCLRRAATRLGRISRGREERLVAPHVRSLGLRAGSLAQPVAELSGGNQQKVLLARWLLRDSEVLLVDEPTRGIDVGARAEVHRQLLELADRGKALVVASSELEELMAICDRIVVMAAGRVRAELRRGEWSAEAIMTAAIGDAGDRAA